MKQAGWKGASATVTLVLGAVGDNKTDWLGRSPHAMATLRWALSLIISRLAALAPGAVDNNNNTDWLG